ncbi:Pre-rRNA-processing protein [Lachnellula hyalina]|uniref:Pre-rRNA-processing protein n=1 Tax=Lachnellula hyalina TaxID=1316788 RepID=A0A8H8QXQ0_9HELO|nr:Pre-rRNA-processing protein [Lachnellula hyalina]TVY24763.1 Pre-rRNA-processing protein [Lachnellula hyalina]
MPKQKAPKGASSEDVSDPRFSNFTTDPRFRLPSKKHTRTTIDKRFSRMLKDDDFANTAKVDRYGRKLSSEGKKKALERLYVPDESDGEDEDKAEVEIEEDDVVEKELRTVDAGYDPARGGGFSSSSEDEDDDDEDGGVEIEEEATFPDMQGEQATVEMGEVSERIAVVNMDWDNVRSGDLMAVFSSFVKPGGKIHKVSVYPSEFGKERMEREELEGPPKEIFMRKADEDDSESEPDSEDSEEDEKIKKDLLKEDDGKDFDDGALRQYQLERLRYFYAVVVCSDVSTAQNIYEATDGTEYLSSANFFDLRFIPDGTTFDDKPRDECTSVPEDYRPTEFVTDALQHSKVKLTWDMAPEEATRKDAINRAFSGSRAEIGENDLRAYLGSDSESEAEEPGPEAESEAESDHGAEPKLSKKDLQRQKMRAALGLADEPAPSSKKSKAGPVGDMEITFTAGLSASTDTTGVFSNNPITTETTAEAYVRKEKERKARRKEKSKAKREGRDPDASPPPEPEDQTAETENLGFDDPFFNTEEVSKASASKTHRKADRLAKRDAKAAAAAVSAAEKAKLSLLMEDASTDAPTNLDHFDINEIARAEKKAAKKRKDRGESKRGGLQSGFEMDVGDERFAGRLFGNHEFAIDPSNPKFKGTEGMKALLEEGRRKRDRVVERRERKRKGGDEQKEGLSSLVESVKKKAKR